MCGPRMKEALQRFGADPPVVDRRSALTMGAAVAGAGVAAALTTGAGVVSASSARGHRRVFDLTYRLTTDFPTFFGPPSGARTTLFDYASDGFYAQRWTFDEQWGTHIDAPGHFGPDAWKVDEIPADHLVAPLAVVDISARAALDPNTVVTVDDLVAYERGNGRIPSRAFVAMNSGWSAKRELGNDAYRGGTGFPDLNFPGFGLEAAMWLATERDAVGIGVDTLSLDPGNSPDFAVHFGFLPMNRYGVENLSGLDDVPSRGTTVVIGAVPWEDGSGGPSRVIAIA